MAISAGLLVYRRKTSRTEFLLGHPGGPLWARRDIGAWMVPKGLVEAGEAPIDAALREFHEETGLTPPPVDRPLTVMRQAGGKVVHCWTAEADLDLAAFKPGAFEMEWPPRSGRRVRYPEMDQLRYFETAEAFRRILPSQAALIAEALLFLGPMRG